MAKKFFTRTTKAKGICPLYIQVAKRTPGISFKLSTGLDVDIATWNRVNRSEKAWRNYIMTDEGKDLNDKLMLIEKTINQLISDGRVMSNDDKDVIVEAIRPIVNVDLIDHQAELERKRREEVERKKRSVIGFYEYFLDGIKDGTIRHGDNKRYSEDSCKVWVNFGEYLRGYCESRDFVFDEITKPFADKFSVYLERSGMMATSVNKLVGCFRKLCNRAAEEGINHNAVSLRVWKERVAHDSEKRTEIYLTDKEISALYEMDLSGKEEAVRDLFVIGCLSCQRFSDYSRLTRDNFKMLDDGTWVISLVQQKTKTYVEVPVIDERIHELCRKYDYDFPKCDKRTLNRYIKEICRKLSKEVPTLAEKHVTSISYFEARSEKLYSRLCQVVENDGGSLKKLSHNERNEFNKLRRYADEHNGSPLWERNERGDVIKPKYELISTHTARRSGVTNIYKTGLLNTREMMSISGHQTEKVFEHYIRVGTSEQASRIAAKFRKEQEAANVVELRKAE